MSSAGPRALIATVPPWSYFMGSAVFHYLGPAFAVLLFARLAPLGVAGLRIWSAALVFALWRRPWRILARLDAGGRRTIVAWGAVLAAMNVCFYLAIDRVPLGTVAAIEFLPVIALAAFGARTLRNLLALVAAVGGVYALTDVRPVGEGLGLVFAFANALLFAAYIVLAHRTSRRLSAAEGDTTGDTGSGSSGGSSGGAGGDVGGIDALAAAMLVASVLVAPVALWQVAPALADPMVLAAGIGVGICSSVIPYVCDQLAMARMTRATYALLVAVLPATATVIGVVVLRQFPSAVELAGVALVVLAVVLHRPTPERA
ncbi:EamA family transporter [Streptosporangium sp. NPDC050855]|uniref:EamA family transporter n=1 Tax=Streptosporangium sp. NPDC050855 TaxID=3366194 RepID=UPI003797802A